MESENKIGYIPIYSYHAWVTVNNALDDLIDCLCRGKDFIIYNSYEKASKIALDSLCDDDSAGVVEVEVSPKRHSIIFKYNKKLIQIKSYLLLEKIKFID